MYISFIKRNSVLWSHVCCKLDFLKAKWIQSFPELQEIVANVYFFSIIQRLYSKLTWIRLALYNDLERKVVC